MVKVRDRGPQLSDDDSPETMLDKLTQRLNVRKSDENQWNDLYNGEEGLLFASPEFEDLTGGLFEDFSDNWCRTVPDATRERLKVTAFQGADGQLDRTAMESWRRNRADVEVGLALLDALVTSRSHAMVWNPTGDASEITFIPTGEAVVDYAPGTRRLRRAGMRTWSDGSYDFATLFVRGQNGQAPMVYRRQRKTGGTWETRTIGLRTSEKTDFPNPMGEAGAVPLVELPNRSRLGGDPESDIKQVAPLQRTVNTLWAHLLTGADYMALPQRVVLGMDKPMRDIRDNDGNIVDEEEIPLTKFSRDRLLWLSKQGANIAQFTAADLRNYLVVIEAAVRHIAAQTRTPPHYLLGEMSNIAADALTAAESGLVAKTKDKQLYFGADIREIVALDALASGDTVRAESLSMGKVLWRDAQYRSEAQYADALTKYKAIGVPDEALWRMMPDVEPEQIEDWIRMRDAAAQSAAAAAAAAFSEIGPKDDAPADDGAEDEEEAA
ncbi:phage portal protein [Streptomyces scabiei]|uniref:phage portal protein n=1 Tax=Streptomyces scabiei TaxID=1930 RepID=UPI001FF1FC8C|nr:phage portal protein [Streptomyces sp. LBUM 1486]